MALVAFQIVPVAFAFFSAALVLILARSLSLREAYEVIEWPLLVMIAALIPVSEAMQSTGAVGHHRRLAVMGGAALPPHGALALILVAGMAVTPFLNNVATVLVMAPIAAQVRRRPRLQSRSVPDRGRDRRGLRFPHPDRAPVQHAGHGSRRLSLRRLLAARAAALDPRHRRRRAAHRVGLSRSAAADQKAVRRARRSGLSKQ